MIKHAFIGFLNGMNETDALRWYLRFHSKEVARFVGPWLRRYETFKAFPPPPEAKRFGAVGGFMTELWYASAEDFTEARANYRPYTPPPGGWPAAGGSVTIMPAMPTEDFLRKEPAPEERHILRWVRMFKYPDGVPPKEADKWYIEVHSQEVKQQTGLLKYTSHRALEKPPAPSPWHRLEELWYEDFEAWRKAVIESPPRYTAPPWRKEEPFVDMVSNFVGYKPSYDFLKDSPLIP
jgi:hypothetical protein